jgi:dTDP-4-amino-4,6-dideoxygalactose transaminase
LKSQYRTLKADIDHAIQSVIDDTAFIRGKYVADFEQAFAREYGVKHCVSVGNGTDAIYITLKMLGIGPGDEVITVANSWISTSETITQTGATVVFVDIEPDYYTIDPSKIEEKITPRTKAIIPVHLYGQPARIDVIQDICRAHKLHLVEDCAQAHFAQYQGQYVGTFGIAGTFSFYPGKNLGAYGDAGAIITDDDELYEKMKMFANHGALQKHSHKMEGMNSRMDGLQAAILSVKLPYVRQWNQQRRANADRYSEFLSGIAEVNVPAIREHSDHIFHLYVIRTSQRDNMQAYLKEKGISTGIHYPTALPFLPAYAYLGHSPQDFPVASAYQRQIISLPMFPELTGQQTEFVTDNIRAFLKGR